LQWPLPHFLAGSAGRATPADRNNPLSQSGTHDRQTSQLEGRKGRLPPAPVGSEFKKSYIEQQKTDDFVVYVLQTGERVHDGGNAVEGQLVVAQSELEFFAQIAKLRTEE
jgi:hypothetical protein